MRRGDGRAEILSLETLGADGNPSAVWQSGENATVRVTVRYHDAVEEPVIGIMIRTRIGLEVYGTNTELEKVSTGTCAAGTRMRIEFAFRCELCPGEYTITAASHDADGTAHDWVDDAVAVCRGGFALHRGRGESSGEDYDRESIVERRETKAASAISAKPTHAIPRGSGTAEISVMLPLAELAPKKIPTLDGRDSGPSVTSPALNGSGRALDVRNARSPSNWIEIRLALVEEV